MDVKTIRSFASGIILATSICTVVYLLEPAEASTVKKEEPIIEQLSAEEMKNQLTAEGYVIHTKEEWQKQKAAIEKEALANAGQKENNDKKEQQEEKPAKEQSEVVYRTVITVSQGMTSIDVGRALQKANMIEKPMDFVNAVEKQGLAKNLKPGSFEVDSTMSMQDVIDLIFKK